ncbi:type II toxin-antitoxin system RelE/ParE family toxin [Mitsuaria sp. GD03876]|uniref:type II toxin-antitoxin system RelE/ParE family toxin n=1 Tax=Mitsuaria sp. GD03876 TaxID=2975399 RepID=UPI0024495FE0|nr:type II toxin-antitoxin system RelE/ParE family toxin [Mitsuaria sp. GD03876]MDH0866397.1 type II toxin-antitoxin system RelE/ParE family toxin [Mitsuaria sp. GD03876]
MTGKRLFLHPQAARDLHEIRAYYQEEGGALPAEALQAEVTRALRHIARAPGTGSPRYRRLLEVTDVRTWRLTKFPHLVFYLDRHGSAHIVRVIHERRDIPSRFHEH